MNEKKLRKSPVVIILYILAALMLVYTFYTAGSTYSQVAEYYSQYGMDPEISMVALYIVQAIAQPLVLAILLFAAGYILHEVRALNPAYYATDEDIAQAKAAKKLAQEKAATKVAFEKVEEAEAAAVVFENIENSVAEKLEEGKDESEAIIEEVIDEVSAEREAIAEEAAEEVAEVAEETCEAPAEENAEAEKTEE